MQDMSFDCNRDYGRSRQNLGLFMGGIRRVPRNAGRLFIARLFRCKRLYLRRHLFLTHQRFGCKFFSGLFFLPTDIQSQALLKIHRYQKIFQQSAPVMSGPNHKVKRRKKQGIIGMDLNGFSQPFTGCDRAHDQSIDNILPCKPQLFIGLGISQTQFYWPFKIQIDFK